ncbi:hypothetical protein [Metamycoplasma equirhinis]|uniref:hypothetical protein n=1 Tax=Metamycoplasma equirhinis TaxID=92402 RepID=UPI0035937788
MNDFLLLFFLLGKFLDSKEKLENKTRFKIIISGSSYAILSILIIALVRPHCKLIATNPTAIDATLFSRIFYSFINSYLKIIYKICVK